MKLVKVGDDIINMELVTRVSQQGDNVYIFFVSDPQRVYADTLTFSELQGRLFYEWVTKQAKDYQDWMED